MLTQGSDIGSSFLCLLQRGLGNVGEPTPSPLLLTLFPAKYSPHAAGVEWLEWTEATLKPPLNPGQWGKQQQLEKKKMEGEGRGHASEHSGKVGMRTCFGNLKKSQETPTVQSACTTRLGGSLQCGWILQHPPSQILVSPIYPWNVFLLALNTLVDKSE